MTPSEFGKLIKGHFHGAFLFYGEEHYLKQHYLSLVRKTICPGDLAVFNHVTLSGENSEIPDLCATVFGTISMAGMMGGTRLVEISDVDLMNIEDTELEELEELLSQAKDFDDCVLILNTRPEQFDAGTDRKPSNILKRLSKVACPVSFARETPARLVTWIQRHFKSMSVTADSAVSGLIIEHCGRDMTVLKNEINKLCAYILSRGKTNVTEQDVWLVTSGNKEIDTFDFANAILDGNTEKAFYVLSDMKLRREYPEIILGSIARVYVDMYTVKALSDSGIPKQEVALKLKMHEYKTGLYIRRAAALSKNGLEKAIALCHEADLKIKSTPLDSYAVLDILIIRLSMACKVQ